MKKYLFIVLLVFFWSCEDEKDENSNTCNEIVSNTDEALSLWSGVLDYYMDNDEFIERIFHMNMLECALQ